MQNNTGYNMQKKPKTKKNDAKKTVGKKKVLGGFIGTLGDV